MILHEFHELARINCLLIFHEHHAQFIFLHKFIGYLICEIYHTLKFVLIREIRVKKNNAIWLHLELNY